MRSFFPFITFTLFFFFCLSSSAQWQLVHTGSAQVWAMTNKGNILYAGDLNGIYYSDDFGASWAVNTCQCNYVRNIVFWDSIMYVTSDYDGVFKSNDNGSTWVSIDSGIANPTQAWSLTHNDSLLILGTSGSFSGDKATIYISSDSGSTWTNVLVLTSQDVFYSFSILGNEIFAGVLPSGLYYSDDKGATWTLKNGIISAKHLGLGDTNLLCGVTGGIGGTYLSTDKGISWLNVLPVQYGYCFASYEQFTFTGNSNGFYYSTDNGYTWTADNLGLPATKHIISICVIDSIVFAGTDQGEIYKKDVTTINTQATDVPDQMHSVFVFPNPTNDVLNIRFKSNEEYRFQLFNVLGEILLDVNLRDESNSINLSGFADDIYFYRFGINTNEYQSGKIIKQ